MPSSLPPASFRASAIDSPGWREFFDLLTDPVVLFDDGGRVVLANTAALRLLPCEAGMTVEQFRGAIGADAVGWLARAAAGGEAPARGPDALLRDGRRLQLGWRRLDERLGALRLSGGTPPLQSPAAPSARSPGLRPMPDARPVPGGTLGAVAIRETIAFFWNSPFPATLQGDDFRILDCNRAFLDFTGYRREDVVGRDGKDFQAPEDWPLIESRRVALRRGVPVDPDLGQVDGHIVDASGRVLTHRLVRRALIDEDGRPLYLSVLQDTTAEQVAREHADRSLRELDDWFGLSPVGMVLFDDRGLLLRANAAFRTVVLGDEAGSEGAVPVSLADAPPAVRDLLICGDAAALPGLEPGAGAAHGRAWLKTARGETRALRSTVRCYVSAGGRRRYMAVVEDRSVEEERDLAQMQIGALIDTAGVGIATFQESLGWVPRRRGAERRPDADGAPEPAETAALQSIRRELVTPETLPEYEKLQAALRHARRVEVRYAIEHPELGRRWLLTRVEPATLASGQLTTSVVTLDVTEQQRSQQRSEELLRELGTILESSSAGIAYLRGGVLARCNRRFEAMLGLPAGTIARGEAADLFAIHPALTRLRDEVDSALGDGAIFETEFELAAGDAVGTRWCSLSVRRVGDSAQPVEAIAVLSDVTRLKAQQTELEGLARDRELMFSLSGVGIAFIRDGRIQRANQALAQLAACSVQELTTLELSELFIDGEDHARRWAQVDRELRTYGRWTGERQLRTRDGRFFWVQVSKRLVRPGDLGGGIIASYVNVEARYRAERSLALQADRTRSILDSVLVGIVTVGPQGIEWMNRSARRMFGGDLADFVNLPIATVATADPAHPFHRTEYLTELVEGQAETFECKVQARDGREFWVVGNVVSIARESTGRQLTYALLDIERRREAEARMSRAQASLQRIIEAAPLAITLSDAKSLAIVQTNGVAADNAGRRRDALIGLVPEDFLPAEVAAERRRDMQEALAAADVTRREYRVVQDGVERLWDARYLPLAAGPGAPADQLLLVETDVTEQRAAQEARLEAAIAQRDMLVQEVHHRIKNNLQGVAGLLQQIAQKKPEVAGAISEVVGQVQAIAQVYGLQVGSAAGPLVLVDVVQAITLSVQRTFGRTILHVVEGASPERWVLPEAESIPIALTLNELLTNAVKHCAVGRDAVDRGASAPGAVDEGAEGDGSVDSGGVERGAAAGASDVVCTLDCRDDAGVRVRISNRARLPPGFDLGRIPGGVSGLGLVRALLPRRSAALTLTQSGDRVVATVRLAPPGVACVVERPAA